MTTATQQFPSVDVVIPCYNYAHFLPACVKSVLDQPGVDVRVLVIDDCSPDNTPGVVAELKAADPRVEGYRHEVNKGHIATYNEGLLDWAKADYTVLLSADDMLAPGALARAAAVFERYPKVGMVYARGVYYLDHDDLPKTVELPLGVGHWSGAKWIEDRCKSGHNVISSPEVVVRTSVQQSVGGYLPDLPHAGDLEMWMRIAAVSDIAYVRGRPGAYYRVHAQSMFRTEYSTFTADLEQRRDAYDRFFANHPALPGGKRLRALAQRALARESLWTACRAYDRDRLDEVPADALADFALKTYPAAMALPEYSAYRRRQRLGAKLCSKTQVFLGTHLVKRGRNLVWWQTWKIRGV